MTPIALPIVLASAQRGLPVYGSSGCSGRVSRNGATAASESREASCFRRTTSRLLTGGPVPDDPVPGIQLRAQGHKHLVNPLDGALCDLV